jgi:hypothetical protein
MTAVALFLHPLDRLVRNLFWILCIFLIKKLAVLQANFLSVRESGLVKEAARGPTRYAAEVLYP